MAIGALVLGILSLVVMWIPGVGLLAIPMSIAAVALGVVSRKQLAAMGQPTGMATAGFVLGLISLILSVIFTLVCGLCVLCAIPFM